MAAIEFDKVYTGLPEPRFKLDGTTSLGKETLTGKKSVDSEGNDVSILSLDSIEYEYDATNEIYSAPTDENGEYTKWAVDTKTGGRITEFNEVALNDGVLTFKYVMEAVIKDQDGFPVKDETTGQIKYDSADTTTVENNVAEFMLLTTIELEPTLNAEYELQDRIDRHDERSNSTEEYIKKLQGKVNKLLELTDEDVEDLTEVLKKLNVLAEFSRENLATILYESVDKVASEYNKTAKVEFIKEITFADKFADAVTDLIGEKDVAADPANADAFGNPISTISFEIIDSPTPLPVGDISRGMMRVQSNIPKIVFGDFEFTKSTDELSVDVITFPLMNHNVAADKHGNLQSTILTKDKTDSDGMKIMDAHIDRATTKAQLIISIPAPKIDLNARVKMFTDYETAALDAQAETEIIGNNEKDMSDFGPDSEGYVETGAGDTGAGDGVTA